MDGLIKEHGIDPVASPILTAQKPCLVRFNYSSTSGNLTMLHDRTNDFVWKLESSMERIRQDDWEVDENDKI